MSSKGEPPLLVMEYMQHGSLYEMLHNRMALLDADMLLRLAKDIATGMTYLHSCKPPILHNDLKTGEQCDKFI
jgi:serine/threonine protein kinase